MATVTLSTATLLFSETGPERIAVWRLNGVCDGDNLVLSTAFSMVSGGIGIFHAGIPNIGSSATAFVLTRQFGMQVSYPINYATGFAVSGIRRTAYVIIAGATP